ncbi:Kinesin-like protein [Parasponia andersonii]|uniref:Kinesin-like protein n=1 Tax=Parasponia andersonii TaxID=3476 RepID=A0A2P5B3C6_PARAD|nr:Kinesin-like protein [Parasponia andersonii]
MRPSNNAEGCTEARFLGTISASSIRNLLPRSISKKKSNSDLRKSKSNAENTPPIDSNILDHGQNQAKPFLVKQSPSDLSDSQPEIAASDDHIQASTAIESPVKVVVRIRPPNDGERGRDQTVKKVSANRVSIGDRKFTFDSVFDSKSNQEEVFHCVGIPLVKNALAGYNTSIVSYGQSGSGKTYTMWGPPSAMVDDPSPRSQQGIVPRIFQMLFSEIDKEQNNSEGIQINFQCRCSFLEIYNEQIGDLLDPTQRNLEIRDDPKNGLYVENLTEEYVTSYEDVMQILIKGLSSRKVGATSVNSKSSRSHIVFTFIIESWSKGTSSKCFGSSKTSRISLIDLAGLDRNKVDVAGSAREAKNVKKSLSRLGHLVNTLANGPKSGKPEDVLYKGSCLTHLLRESLGGNSRLTVLCAISPDFNNDGEILGTLRFGQRVKSVGNEPVINEITEDDVNDLSDQIRQLKEELIRAKSSANSVVSKPGYFQGRNVRDSLNQLRVSLNRSLLLPRIDHESDEELHIDEDDVKELQQQLDKLRKSCEENVRDRSCDVDSIQLAESCETDLMSEDDITGLEEMDTEEIDLEKSQTDNVTLTDDIRGSLITSRAVNSDFRSSISITSCRPAILQEPTLSESPKIGKNQRKSVVVSASYSVGQKNVAENSHIKSDGLRQSLSQTENIRSSLRSSKIFPGLAESLAASLQRGLDIIENHQRNSASNKSSVAFSFEHLTLQPCPEVDKANSPGQTQTFICASCRGQVQKKDSDEVQDSLKTWIVPVTEAGNSNKDIKNLVEEAATKREDLENRCMEQAAKIELLNQLIEQMKREKHNSIGEGKGQNEIIPLIESENEDSHSVKDENKLIRCGSIDNHHPGIIEENYEIKEVQNESVFDMNEKEALLKEIQILRSKLQSQTDASLSKSTERLRSSLLSRSIQLRKSDVFQNNNDDELEKERQRWTEMESEWISLTDELRIDIDVHRRRAEKVEKELKSEKQCTEGLDDALQRAVLGHARMVEHYADLQEKYNDLVAKHRAIMEGIAEVKKAAVKAGKKGQGARFAKSLAAELSTMRVERERERELLKKENKSLKIQLRDTAEAVHAAGELLVRLREAEHAASVAEENLSNAQYDNEKLRKQIEKQKRKHKMEMVTMKQYLAESRLPESALQPLYREDSDDIIPQSTMPDDDQAWRAEFGAIYQDHY